MNNMTEPKIATNDLSDRYNQRKGQKMKELSKKEKAEIILENMEKYLQVDYGFKDFYIKGIVNGLNEIEKEEGARR